MRSSLERTPQTTVGAIVVDSRAFKTLLFC